MESRISKRLSSQLKEGRKALIPFIMPGIYDMETTVNLVLDLEKSGSDVIEIGIPFSDPVADGPVIQKVAQLALEKGIYTPQVFELVGMIRKKTSIPLVFLVYYNCVFKYGKKEFIEECANRGVDGLIIPDLPFEENGEMAEVLSDVPVDLITLATPTSGERLKKIIPPAKGFVYCVSTTGVTGERQELPANLKDFLMEVKNYTSIPRAVGFGISSAEHVEIIKDYCEGVIVGSALLRRLMNEGYEEGIQFMRDLRSALDE